MHKYFLSVALLVLSLLTGWFWLKSWQFVNKTLHHEKTSLQEVLESSDLRTQFGIGVTSSPSDYHFTTFTEEEFSATDGVPLAAWFVQSAARKDAPCLVFAHGRETNRLKTMKYLELVRQAGLQGQFHIFLPDLRNSGSSGKADNLLGYGYALDLQASLLHLQKKYGIKKFVLYGFDTGAMGSLLAATLPEIHQPLKERQINISGLVMDSPLSNAEEYLRRNMNGASEITYSLGTWMFNNRAGQHLDRMRLGVLGSHPQLPVLVLQNLGDEQTPTDMLLSEVGNAPHVELELFDGEDHCRIFTNPKYRQKYVQRVKNFLLPLLRTNAVP